MDVMKMSFKIRFIPDVVFPEMALPDAAPPVAQTRCGAPLFLAALQKPFVGEPRFDSRPAT